MNDNYTPEQWQTILRNAQIALRTNPRDPEAISAIQDASAALRDSDSSMSLGDKLMEGGKGVGDAAANLANSFTDPTGYAEHYPQGQEGEYTNQTHPLMSLQQVAGELGSTVTAPFSAETPRERGAAGANLVGMLFGAKSLGVGDTPLSAVKPTIGRAVRKTATRLTPSVVKAVLPPALNDAMEGKPPSTPPLIERGNSKGLAAEPWQQPLDQPTYQRRAPYVSGASQSEVNRMAAEQRVMDILRQAHAASPEQVPEGLQGSADMAVSSGPPEGVQPISPQRPMPDQTMAPIQQPPIPQRSALPPGPQGPIITPPPQQPAGLLPPGQTPSPTEGLPDLSESDISDLQRTGTAPAWKAQAADALGINREALEAAGHSPAEAQSIMDNMSTGKPSSLDVMKAAGEKTGAGSWPRPMSDAIDKQRAAVAAGKPGEGAKILREAISNVEARGDHTFEPEHLSGEQKMHKGFMGKDVDALRREIQRWIARGDDQKNPIIFRDMLDVFHRKGGGDVP